MYQSLTLRKTQLRLLADACRRGQPASIVLRAKPQAPARPNSRMRALERDGVLVDCPGARGSEAAAPGSQVRVCFMHEGQRYFFVANTRERLDHLRDCAGAALKLSMPLCVERANRRRRVRFNPENLDPVDVQLTAMFDQQKRFAARLTDLSCGGMGGLVPAAASGALHAADLFWAEFGLPGQTGRIEFVVWLIHRQDDPDAEYVRCGWAFCGGDDPARHDENLSRLETFLTWHRQRKARDTSQSDSGGI